MTKAYHVDTFRPRLAGAVHRASALLPVSASKWTQKAMEAAAKKVAAEGNVDLDVLQKALMSECALRKVHESIVQRR